MFGLATRDMPPSRAGIGAGVLDTVQEFGAVLATAVLGAFLANRLAASMRTQAAGRRGGVARAGQGAVRRRHDEPPVRVGSRSVPVRRPAWRCPDGVPAPVVEQIHAAAQHVFAAAFTDAMRPTMVVPIVVILLAAGAVLFVRSKPARLAPDRARPVGDPEPSACT